MQPHITIITLAVNDIDISLRFYRDGLGLSTKGILPGSPDHVLFEMQNGLSLVIFLRSELAKITGETNSVKNPGHFILSHATGTKEEVDAILQQADVAGATRIGQPKEEEWGYYGYFKDPDGHLWEIVWHSVADSA